MTTKSAKSKTKTKAKSPYQEMLQRDIDGYMAEKQPDSHSKVKKVTKIQPQLKLQGPTRMKVHHQPQT